MNPDIEKYRRYVERFDLTEEQKVEVIYAVWRIMESFADRAFGIGEMYAAGSRKLAQRADGKVRLTTQFKTKAGQLLPPTIKTTRKD